MFHNFDLVTLEKPLPGADVPVGAEGTVIRVFGWMNPIVYDVVFHDENHKSLGAFHVWGDEALAVKRSLLQEMKGYK
jgi:hypothetical protein